MSGYIVSKQSLITRLARAEVDAADARRLKDEGKGGKWDMDRGEGGYGGLESMEDKYATTR